MSEKKIKESIDAIKPKDGAKERMYQNILKKSQQQSASAVMPSEKKKSPIQFMRYALPAAACFCLFIVGLFRLFPGNTPSGPNDSEIQGGNPFAEVKSAEDFKTICITLDAPTGAHNVQYTIIDNKIAEVRFEMDGKNYTARASAQSGDFSGLYGSEEKIETIDAAQNAVLSAVQVDGSRYYKIVWTNGKVGYCLYGTSGAAIAQIKAVYHSIVK